LNNVNSFCCKKYNITAPLLPHNLNVNGKRRDLQCRPHIHVLSLRHRRLVRAGHQQPSQTGKEDYALHRRPVPDRFGG